MNKALFATTAVAGIGIRQFKRGQSPMSERTALVHAIVDACAEAGLDPADVDGFVSYGDDKNEPVRLMPEPGDEGIMLVAGGVRRRRRRHRGGVRLGGGGDTDRAGERGDRVPRPGAGA